MGVELQWGGVERCGRRQDEQEKAKSKTDKDPTLAKDARMGLLSNAMSLGHPSDSYRGFMSRIITLEARLAPPEMITRLDLASLRKKLTLSKSE